MFGGGVFDKKRDHKEIMLDVIAKSKKFKYERQKESEQTKDAFEKLDNDFKDIAKLTGQFVRDDDAKVSLPFQGAFQNQDFDHIFCS